MKHKGDYRRRIFDKYVSAAAYECTLFGKAAFRGLEKNYHRFLPADRNAKVLEIASGRGDFATFLKNNGYKNYTGIDLSAEQVECARKMLPGYEFINADALEYISGDHGKYDLVIARHVLEHLYKDEVLDLLERIREVLNPGGVFIAEVPNCGSLIFGGRARYSDFTHETGFTLESAMQVFKTTGFNIKFCGVVRKPRVIIDVALWTCDMLIRAISGKGDISIYPVIYICGSAD